MTQGVLNVQLGKALSQQRDELEYIKNYLAHVQEELSLIKVERQHIQQENEALRQTSERQKSHHKHQQSKVAQALKKTLAALKILEKEHLSMSDSLKAYQEALELSFQEKELLAKQKIEILNSLFEKDTNDNTAELETYKTKSEQLEKDIQEITEKANKALLLKDEEMKRLKSEFQAILKKHKEDTLLFIQNKEMSMQRVLESERKDTLEHTKMVLLLKQTLEKKNEQIEELEECMQQLKITLDTQKLYTSELNQTIYEKDAYIQSETKMWNEKTTTLQSKLTQTEQELSKLVGIKAEYDEMRALFSNIKNFMGNKTEEPSAPPSPLIHPPSIISEHTKDLFSRPAPGKPIRENLF